MRSTSIAGAVLMDGPAPDMTAARSLQLAAENSPGILVLPDTDLIPPSAAITAAVNCRSLNAHPQPIGTRMLIRRMHDHTGSKPCRKLWDQTEEPVLATGASVKRKTVHRQAHFDITMTLVPTVALLTSNRHGP